MAEAAEKRLAMAEAAEKQFAAFLFEKNENWTIYLRNITLPDESEAGLTKLRRKWFRTHVDYNLPQDGPTAPRSVTSKLFRSPSRIQPVIFSQAKRLMLRSLRDIRDRRVKKLMPL